MASSQKVADQDGGSTYEDALSDLDNLSRTDSQTKLALEAEAALQKERENLGSKTSYLLTLIGYAVGFGNLWRFPYRLQTYGGIFLVPYFIAVACLGLPVLYLELSIGQRLRKGPVGAWNEVSPYLGGIGITSGITCLFVGFYYNTLVAYCISYFMDTWHLTLPWHSCKEAVMSLGVGADPAECAAASNPSVYYWFRGVLDVSDDIETLGNFRWEMYIYLIMAWFLVGFILIKGLAFTGKVVYFTALFPYFVLFIFLVFGWTLPGMGNGYKEMFKFKFEKLKDAKIWMDAASQIFFSLGVGYGVLISYSSSLPARNNAWLDSLVVVIVNCSTSIMACCTVYGILGFKGTESYESCHRRRALALVNGLPYDSLETCQKLSEYINESAVGTGLAFIAFTEAIKKLPVPQLFNFLFFLMLLTLGIDSSFGTVEGAIASILDMYPKLQRWKVAAGLVWLLTVFSIFFAFGWGNHVLTLLDTFSVDYQLLIVSFMECTAVGWVYGLGRFSYDLQLMTGRRPTLYMLVCIKYVSPLVMLTLIVASISLQILGGRKSFEYSPWNKTTSSNSEGVLMNTRSIILAFLVVFVCLVWIPLVAILRAVKKPIIKPNIPEAFPENDLRKESGFDLHPHLRHISGAERLLFGSSIHDFPSAAKMDGEGSDTQIPPQERLGSGSTINIRQT